MGAPSHLGEDTARNPLNGQAGPLLPYRGVPRDPQAHGALDVPGSATGWSRSPVMAKGGNMSWTRAVLAMVGLALIVGLGGCGGNPSSESPPANRGETAASGAPPASAPSSSAASLGTAQAAGPFQVTLSVLPAAPKVGDLKFQATVTRGGQPMRGAAVTVDLTMPSTGTNVPTATLNPAGDHYEGTVAVGTAGDWEAKVAISASGEDGAASYQFAVSPS